MAPINSGKMVVLFSRILHLLIRPHLRLFFFISSNTQNYPNSMWLFYVCCFLIFQWIGEASCQQLESKTNWPFPFNTFIPLRQSKELHTLGHFDDYFTHLPQWKIVYGINCRFGYSLSVSTNWNVIWYLLGKANLFLFIWFCSAEFCHRAKKKSHKMYGYITQYQRKENIFCVLCV